MRVEIPIYKLLSEASSIAAIVNDRIFPNFVPQGTSGDCITYHSDNGTSYDTKTSFNDYGRKEVQISVFCTQYDVASALIETIRLELERKSGSYGSAPAVVVDNIFYQGEQDMGFLDDVEKFHKVIEFSVFINN